MNTPKLIKTKNGWVALGKGWGVEADTEENAICRFEEAEARHKEIERRPLFFERRLKTV